MLQSKNFIYFLYNFNDHEKPTPENKEIFYNLAT